MNILPKSQSILTRPSVASFLSRDSKSPMHAKPWRWQIAFQDDRFRRENRDDHPSFECRWQLHQLRQKQHIELMASVHAGLTPDELNPLWLKHKLEYDTASGALWAAVVWPEKRMGVAA